MKTFKNILLAFALLTVPFSALARAPEKVALKSDSMGIDINNLVILPDDYDAQNMRYPVVYLLHGYGGNQDMWFHMRPDLVDIATKKKMIFVLPDGGKSWYWDAPKNPKSKYETYITKELLPYIDEQYRTIATPQGRAITGLSMGGHGSLWLAMRNPDLFGACGSQSGGVDIRPFPKNWSIIDSLGEYEANRDVWTQNTIMGNLELLKNAGLAIIIDCGYEDFFFAVNEALHYEMVKMKIPHDYITRPGAHNGDYWKNSLDYQLLFFKKFFDKE